MPNGDDNRIPLGYLETLMHLFKGNIGSGIFAMGDATKNAGIILGPVLTLCLGIIAVHCQHLLLRESIRMNLSEDVENSPYFAETVELCFATGPKKFQKFSKSMKMVVNIFLCMTQLGFCCVYFVFISDNVKQVVDYHGYEIDVHIHMVIALLPILLTTFVKDLNHLGPLSILANVFMVIGITITLFYCTQDLPLISERNYVATWPQIPLYFGTALFSFEGIGLVLPLLHEMKEPNNFYKPLGVLNVGMSVVIFFYVIVGFLSYLKYGKDIMGSTTLNLPETEMLAQSVKIVISLGILFTFALQLFVAAYILWPSVENRFGPFKYPVLSLLVFRAILVLITFAFAEAVPFLEYFISLVGSVSGTALILIFPPILELLTASSFGELSFIMLVKDVFILIMGVVGMFTGGYISILSMVHAFGSDNIYNNTTDNRTAEHSYLKWF